MLEYVWIDHSDCTVRSKSKISEKPIKSLKDLDEWNYDGSTTGQKDGRDSTIVIKPVAYFKDPFNEGDSYLVLCDSYYYTDKEYTKLVPAKSNFRYYAK